MFLFFFMLFFFFFVFVVYKYMVKYFYGCDLCVIIKSEKKYNDIKFFIAKI